MKLPRYPAYKAVDIPWIGEAPSHWELTPLLGVASERAESNAGFLEDNLLSLSYGEIIRKEIGSNDGLLPESFETYQIIHEGDIVLRLTDLQNDKRSLRSARAMERGIITSAYLALRPERIDSAFLAHLLRAMDQSKVFYSMGGGLRQSMKYADLKRMPILIPPQGEQAAIAAFLDRETAKIDTLIAEQERLLELLTEKRQAVISHAVTKGLNPDAPMKDSGVAWLGEVPAHWEVFQLRRLIAKFEQGWSPDCETRPAEETEWGVLKAGCVNWGVFVESENKALPPTLVPRPELMIKTGDLLMSRASGSPRLIGSVAMVENLTGRLMLSDKIFRLNVTSSVEPRYLAIAMGSSPLRQQIEQSIGGAEGLANNLPQSRIKDFWLAVPPKAEQLEILCFVDAEASRLSALAEEAKKATTLLLERRSALIAAAVTGQIDVREAA